MRTRAKGGNDAEEPVMLKGVHDGHLNRSKPKSFDRLEFLWENQGKGIVKTLSQNEVLK